MINKPCCSRFSLHKFVQLKWTQFKNVHLQGPCSLRPCISRPCCIQKSKWQKVFICNCENVSPFANVIFFCHLPWDNCSHLNSLQQLFYSPAFVNQIPNLQMDIVCHFKFYLNRRNHIRLGQSRKAPIVILEY